MPVSMPNPQAFQAWFEARADQARSEIASVAEFVAERGEQVTRDKSNRIDTGLLRGSISSSVADEGDTITARFGFLDEQQDYFAYQTTTGFTLRDGRFMEPTFALRDAYEDAKNYAESRLR